MFSRSPEGKPYPGLHQKKCSQQVEGGDSATLICSDKTPAGVHYPAVEPCIELWRPQHRKDVDLLEWVQRKFCKIIKESKL